MHAGTTSLVTESCVLTSPKDQRLLLLLLSLSLSLEPSLPHYRLCISAGTTSLVTESCVLTLPKDQCLLLLFLSLSVSLDLCLSLSLSHWNLAFSNTGCASVPAPPHL